MPGERILVVDDDEDILELLNFELTKQGYHVTCRSSGHNVVEDVTATPPDLIVLDVMLPMVDGLEICRALKSDPRTAVLPILMLSAKGAESDVVAGFECGADDYVAKPFSTKVLGTRIKALLRREVQTVAGTQPAIRVGDLVLDPTSGEATLAGAPLGLTMIEFRILYVLATQPGWAFARSRIAAAVHGDSNVTTDRAVDVQISGLRKKLGAFGDRIETVRGIGYRLTDE